MPCKELPSQMKSICRIESFLIVLVCLCGLPYCFGQLRQFAEDRNAAPPLFVVERRRAAYHGARFNVAMRAALGGDHNAIADLAVSGHAHLAGQDYILSQLG